MMIDYSHEEMKKFAELWQRAVDVSDWKGAFTAGISAYLYFLRDGGERSKEAAIGLIVAANELQHRGSKSSVKQVCSFCGQSPPKVKLGAGPDAFICNECVETFSEIFKSK
jgi:ClpX C4-type zinc finger